MIGWLKNGWVALLATVLLAGCGGSGEGTGSGTTDPTAPVPASIELVSSLVNLQWR